jgi:hypothetical protein
MAKGSRAPEAPAVHVAPRGQRKITVASKMPMDIILQLCRETESRVTGQFGATTEKVFVKSGPTVMIRGVAYPVGQVPKGFPKAPNMIEEAGYALTSNVDADFFEQWLKQNADTDMVLNGMIKAHIDLASLEDDAMDFAKVQSGLQPLDPDTDSRNPKPINTAVAKVTTDDRAPA